MKEVKILKGNYLYRFEAKSEATGYMNEAGDWISSRYTNDFIELLVFSIAKETPKGFWIEPCENQRIMYRDSIPIEVYSGPSFPFGDRIFVRKSAKRKFAYETVERALEAIFHKNKFYLDFLNKRIKVVKKHSEIIQELKNHER